MIRMKKIYEKPAMQVVACQPTSLICQSEVKSLENNAGLRLGGGGSGEARSKQRGEWEDDWDLF